MSNIAAMADGQLLGLQQASSRAMKMEAAALLRKKQDVRQAILEVAGLTILRAMAIGILASELKQIRNKVMSNAAVLFICLFVPRMARKLDLSETAGDNPWRRR